MSKIFFEDVSAGAGYGFDRLGSRQQTRLGKTGSPSQIDQNRQKIDKNVEGPFKGA